MSAPSDAQMWPAATRARSRPDTHHRSPPDTSSPFRLRFLRSSVCELRSLRNLRPGSYDIMTPCAPLSPAGSSSQGWAHRRWLPAAARASERGRIVLRLSHSMTAGPDGAARLRRPFRELAEAATGGAVDVRAVSQRHARPGARGRAAAPGRARRLHGLGHGDLGQRRAEAAGVRLPVSVARLGRTCTRSSTAASDARPPTISSGAVRMRPLAWGDSFGFRQVVTRSRDVTEPGQLAGLKIRTIQSPIYVKAVELMGASPTPMAFGEVYTSLQTGVIDGYEHDASTTLQQRFYEVARSHGAHASHRRRARALRVDVRAGAAARATSARRSSRPRSTRPRAQRAMGPREDAAATAQLAAARHDDPGNRQARRSGRRPNGSGTAEARALDVDAVARGDPRVTHRHGSAGAAAAARGSRAPAGPSPSSSSRRPRSSACRSSAVTSCGSRFPGPRRSPGCCSAG